MTQEQKRRFNNWMVEQMLKNGHYPNWGEMCEKERELLAEDEG